MRPRLHRYCSRLVGSAVDGEDVVQDTVEHALAALQRGVQVEKPDAWLFRIAHNSAMDHLRRHARESVAGTPDDLDQIEDPTADAEQRVTASMALHLFMQLPVGQRATVILMDVLGYELAEIGRILDLSLAATKSSLHRGRTRLRELASSAPASPRPPVSTAARELHSLYARLFNGRDFDAIRGLLSEDFRLDLVNGGAPGELPSAGTYFGNYARLAGWRITPGLADGRLAAVFLDATGTVRNFALLHWREGRLAAIRDFHHAPYVLEHLAIELLD